MKWIVLALVVAVFVAVIVYTVKSRKQGGCSCGCGECGMKDVCHKKQG